MKWTFIYYSTRIEKEIFSLPKGLLYEFFSMKKIMEQRGPSLGMPYTKAMGEGLFEMRLRDPQGIARIFYCTVVRNEIMVLHSFVKKTQKTPLHDLQIAKKRMKEIKNHG